MQMGDICPNKLCETNTDADLAHTWEPNPEDLRTETADTWEELTGISQTAEMKHDKDRRYTRDDFLERTGPAQ